eukprot:CAMPEP_0172476392 /NCGR_PEP_ID=MMETSP1065-20121228/70355_1 /TAXON_ID=265537 /ORGANISM="Amphiprora paludosa, Strain CCMP125" /LENGTH=405 /DNA_ID=CAMNT_0013234613 /DNA_START=1634 /DNA_END=2851 /DNA_ORIENTATION=+
MVRATIPNKKKLKAISAAKRAKEEGISIHQVARTFNFQHSQLIRWMKQEDQLKQSKPKTKSTNHGMQGILQPATDDFLRWWFELRQQGFQVTHFQFTKKAEELSREFKMKTETAKPSIINRFLTKHNLVLRMRTNESQTDPRKTVAKALDYILHVARLLCIEPTRHQDFIMNMDQTPVYFDMSRRKTLERRGARSVPGRKSTCDTKRMTCAVFITASGLFLPTLNIFKGILNDRGRIVREFTNPALAYPQSEFYSVQSNAWMDEQNMEISIEKILKPHMQKCPFNAKPLLFLDHYRCHLMASVVHKIEDMGIQVEHIPGGCTSLCQPVDIGVNKPFKDRIRKMWEEWMLEEGLLEGVTKPPERNMVAKWIKESKELTKKSSIINAWRRGEYSHFFVGPATEEYHN